MKKVPNCIWIALVAVLFLTGCTVTTVDEMYHLPKRSDSYNNLQSAMDTAMVGLEYSAPVTGENQQNVQMADLDGDGENEFLIFAKGTAEKPLRILVLRNVEDTYVLAATMLFNGSGFDHVEYVDMDGRPGVEIVVGCRLSDQLIRSASVYTQIGEEMVQLGTVNYSRLMMVDLDGNAQSELFVLRPGQSDTENGVAELYSVKADQLERSNEVGMSQTVDKLKRMIVGTLDGGVPAVFAASTVDDTALVTDVYALLNGVLTNVAFSNESGTSVQTMRNFYIYADDIDNDTVVELPALMNMKPIEMQDARAAADRHHLIRWYAMTVEGLEVDKMYTFHNFVGGWYVQLESAWAPRLTVYPYGNQYQFHIWNEEYKSSDKVFTIIAHTGQNREEQAAHAGFVIQRTESTVYTAKLEPAAEMLSLTQQSLISNFRMIQQDWKTGET